MATFYLLPSRPRVGERLASFLEAWLPGVRCSSADWFDLAEMLTLLFSRQADCHVVFREELPCDEHLPQSLRDGFGAEPGDEVVEIPEAAPPRRWQIGELPECGRPSNGRTAAVGGLDEPAGTIDRSDSGAPVAQASRLCSRSTSVSLVLP